MTAPVPTEEEVAAMLDRVATVASFGHMNGRTLWVEAHSFISRLWEAHKAIEAYSKARIEVVEAGYADAMRRAEHAEKALKEARVHVHALLMLRDEDRPHPLDEAAQDWLSRQDTPS